MDSVDRVSAVAETQNPIEALERALTKFEAYTTSDIETTLKADARLALESVGAVVAALRGILGEVPDKPYWYNPDSEDEGYFEVELPEAAVEQGQAALVPFGKEGP